MVTIHYLALIVGAFFTLRLVNGRGRWFSKLVVASLALSAVAWGFGRDWSFFDRVKPSDIAHHSTPSFDYRAPREGVPLDRFAAQVDVPDHSAEAIPVPESDSLPTPSEVRTDVAPAPPATVPAPIAAERASGSSEPVVASIVETLESNPPEWMQQVAGLGADSVYRVRETIGPFTTLDECQRSLPGTLEKLALSYVYQYVETHFDAPHVRTWLRSVPLDLRRRIVARTWAEKEDFSVGPMWQLHVQLEFDREAQAEITPLYRRAVAERRLWLSGSLGFMVLAILGTLFGYLKLDTATRGNYRRRLTVLASLLIALAGGGMLAITSQLRPLLNTLR